MPIDYLNLDSSIHASKERFWSTFQDSPPKAIAVDVETISLKERMPIGFGIGISPNEAYYFHIHPEPDPEIQLVLPLLRDPAVKKVLHNAPFDLRCFPLIADIDNSNIADTNVMARLLGYIDTKLAHLWEIHRRHITPASELLKGGKTMLDIDPAVVSKHCIQDVMATMALYENFMPRLMSAGMLDYFNVEMKAIPILIEMSLRGIKINQHDRQDIEDALAKEVNFYKDYCTNQLPSHERFNPGSTQQAAYVLSSRGSFLPFVKKDWKKPDKKRGLSTAKEVLEGLADPLAQMILSYRKSSKLLGTYIIPLRGKDRAYTEYNLDAVVGRVSSSNYNMQNIPGVKAPINVRQMYMPDNYIFTTGDYSQEHLRILCYLSGDKEMEAVYFHGEHDGDIHSKTAAEIGVSRQTAKAINYAIPYGATSDTINQQGKLHNSRKAKRFLEGWFRTYRQAANWLQEAQDYGLRHQWALPTLFGRHIYLPIEGSSRAAHESMKRKAVNYPILGSDGEVMKRALIICKRRNLPMSVTVHDSITLDGAETFPMEELENITPFRLPFDVKQTLRWE